MKAIALILIGAIAFAQEPAKPTEADIENKDLSEAVNDANNSPIDLIRLLEAFLKKHPKSGQRVQVERELARDAINTQDDRRTVLYGERALAVTPDDLLLLDRVAKALLALGGAENAEKSLKYSRAFEQNIRKAPPVEGKDAARKQDERERALARVLLFQARAKRILGAKIDAEKLAAESFSIYPAAEAAREWAETLESLGRDKDALERWADAFMATDSKDNDRLEDRRRLGELYQKVHHSEKGLGDLLVASYDSITAKAEERRKRLQAMDPNFNAADPMQFTLAGLDGKKLPLASLKGSVVILDFWATWCTPCRAQHPLYEEVKQRFKDRKDVVFLSIDTDEDRNLVAPFLDQQKWSRGIYFDDGLQRLLQVSSIPTTVMFDKQGRVASRMNGFLPEKFVDQLTERIRIVLDDGAAK